MKKLIENHPVTAVMLSLLALVVISGCIAVVTGNYAHSDFAAFLDDLKTFFVGLGLLATGRGLVHIGTSTRQAASLDDTYGDPNDSHGHSPREVLGDPPAPRGGTR